jgi:hypothetical protein
LQNNRDRATLFLRNVCPWAPKAFIDEILGVWLSVRHRILTFYESALYSYFQFLKLNGDKGQASNITISTLRLFKLLLKYAEGFEDEIAKGFKDTSASPWKDIIPQVIIAYFSH